MAEQSNYTYDSDKWIVIFNDEYVFGVTFMRAGQVTSTIHTIEEFDTEEGVEARKVELMQTRIYRT